MIRNTAQSSLVNNVVKQNNLGKEKNKRDQNGDKRDENGGKRDQNESSVGNDVNRGNGGQNDGETSNKDDNNKLENANPNIFDQLSASGQLLVVIIFFDDEYDYVIFLVLH